MGVNGSMPNVFVAVFSLFGNHVVEVLGVTCTSIILDVFSAVLVPVPLCLWYWGDTIRVWSFTKIPVNVLK